MSNETIERPVGDPAEYGDDGFKIIPQHILEGLPETPTSLSLMLGDFEHVKGSFWSRPPKIKGQRQIFQTGAKMTEQITKEGEASDAVFNGTLVMASLLLFREVDGEMQPVTPEEVEDCDLFDLAELSEIVRKNTGVKMSTSKPGK